MLQTMEVDLLKDSKRKTPNKWVKLSSVECVLTTDYLQAKKGDKAIVKRFFCVQDKHFVNPFMATIEMTNGDMVGKTIFLNSFRVGSFKKQLTLIKLEDYGNRK